MNTIVLLCGGNNAGKTTTWRRFFSDCFSFKSGRYEAYTRVLEGKTVYGVGADSIQEQLRRNLCDLKLVKKEIENRIHLCEMEARGQSYVLIFPYGLYENFDRTKLNEDCFLTPVEWLRTEKGFNVLPIYLRKTKANHKARKDELARKVCVKEIETSVDDCDKSKEVEAILIDAISDGTIP